MPRLIKQGSIVEDQQQLLSLEQWLSAQDKSGLAVQLEPDQPPDPLFDKLAEIPLIAINFPVFTDGRGFSYARELRERGFVGELRACGQFIRDQMTYLHRVGFDAFQLADESELEEAVASLKDFSEFYQAAIDQPLPLFRRRN